jgi:crossover junction endodeoxyribonuclease RuvC
LAFILGIDPGSLRTGWGIINSDQLDQVNGRKACVGAGVIDLSDKLSLAERLGLLQQSMEQIIRQHQPHEMSIEKVFLGRNPDSAFKLGHARGVVMALAGIHKMRVAEYATRHVKKMLTGQGGASKEQVQFLVQHMLGIKIVSLDATDALALALCHSRERETLQLLARQQSAREL